MENKHVEWLNPLSMTIFNSYMSLPEAILYYSYIEDGTTLLFWGYGGFIWCKTSPSLTPA